MVELLGYLEANGFSNYIASGGGRDFMRPISQEVYGIPRERVIGSASALEYVGDASGGTITHKPEADYLDDGPQKPIRIWSRTGRRPLLAAGNSNGDIPMLEFARHADKPFLALLVLHDDADREFDYTGGAERALERPAATAGRSSASRTTGPPSSDDSELCRQSRLISAPSCGHRRRGRLGSVGLWFVRGVRGRGCSRGGSWRGRGAGR